MQPRPVPILRTHRLILAAPRAEDLPESAAMWGEAEVTRHIGGRPFSREEVWQRLLRYIGHWAALGFGQWIVRERASGRLVGEVGLFEGRRDSIPPIEDVPECGWALAPWAHRQGFAREALTAALGWADEHLDASATICLIDAGNLRSRDLALGFGYREVGPIAYRAATTTLYRRARGTAVGGKPLAAGPLAS